MDGHRLLGHSPLPFLAQVCSLWVKKLCDFNLEESGGSSLVSLSSFPLYTNAARYCSLSTTRTKFWFHPFTFIYFIRDFYGVLDLEPGPPLYGFCTYLYLGSVSLGDTVLVGCLHTSRKSYRLGHDLMLASLTPFATIPGTGQEQATRFQGPDLYGYNNVPFEEHVWRRFHPEW